MSDTRTNSAAVNGATERKTVATIRLQNVGGIDFLEFHPAGGVTFIDGRNGLGKTSLINGLKSLSEGGHDPSLLKNGAEEGEITLILNDKSEISKVITQKDSTLTVRDAQRRVKSAPKTYLNSLLDTWAVDPMKFLREKPKDRLQMLLNTLPIELTADHKALLKSAGVPASDFELKHPLMLIDDARKQVFDERTFVNRSSREAKAAAEKNRENLPADWGRTNHADELKSLELRERGLRQTLADERRAADRTKETKVQEIETRFTQKKHEFETELREAISTLDLALTNEVSTLDRELERKIAELRAEHAKHVSEIKETHAVTATATRDRVQAKLDEAREAKDSDVRNEDAAHIDAIRAIDGEYTPAIEEAVKQIASLQTLVESENSFRTLADQASAFDEEHRNREVQSAILSESIENIDAIKRELLSNLPAGLEIRDSEIYRNDIPFDRLNKAQQMRLAIELARLKSKGLCLMLVDEGESWDADSLEAIEDLAQEFELQLIITRMMNGEREIRVRTEAESEVVA